MYYYHVTFTVEHNVKCSVCRDPTIFGFRYKCLQCQNFNMCQVTTFIALQTLCINATLKKI